MQEDTDSDEIYEEDTDSVSPARLAQRPAVKEAEGQWGMPLMQTCPGP